MKAVVAAFNQEKALVGAFSVITNLRICFGWNFLKHYMEVADTGAVQRTRLQSIKQMSVDRIANLRNRLAEGRRLLKTRAEAGEGGARVELVTPDITTGPLLAVQTDTGTQRYFLSGTG